MADSKTAIAPQDFLKMAAETDDRLELVNGEVLRMVRPGARHGIVLAELSAVLIELIPRKDFRVLSDIGILLASGNVRGPDICLISAERIRTIGLPIGWWPEAVELAVEIVGSEDRQADLDRKTEEYFTAGVKQVWRVNPETRKIAVYRSPKDVKIAGEEDELSATDLHPALKFPVRRVFE